jgi:shikimate dehydrogenase
VTLRFAVIGAPVAHSRSPAMHEAAYRVLGIDARYESILVEPGGLSAFVEALGAEGFRGVNVTLPHKGAVIPLLDEVSDAALAIGAVNVITVDGARRRGDNMDAEGLTSALEEAGVRVRDARVVVLGAGGAARAAVYGLGSAGAASITIATRRAAGGDDLVSTIGERLRTPLAATDLGDGLRKAFADADLVVQCTSATLGQGDDARAFASLLPFVALSSGAVVADIVYEPRKTTVLAAAEARGLRTVDGLGMLVHQGALSFERWLGRPAPISAMWDAVRRLS